MNNQVRIEWSKEAQSKYDQMPENLQKMILKGLTQQEQISRSAFQRRSGDVETVNMVSHLQLTNFKIWLELSTRYHEASKGAILLIQTIRESSANEAIQQKTAELERLKEVHLNRTYKMISADNRNMYPFDLFASAVYKRSMALIDGFLKMIPSNYICAAPLVRLQIDNVLRFYAANRVSVDIHEFAMDVMSGTSIKDMRDKDNPKQKLTDAHLVQQFKHIEPRIEKLYKETSGYIHLSEKHIYNSIKITPNKLNNTIEFYVSEKDRFIVDEDRLEALTAMIIITEKLLWLLDGWIFVKDNPAIAKEAWDRGKEFLVI